MDRKPESYGLRGHSQIMPDGRIIPISDSFGSAKVAVQDLGSELLDLFMCISLNSVSIAIDTSIDDQDITFSPGHGFVVGNTVCLKEGHRFYQGVVLAVNVNVITVDTPLDHAFTTSAIGERTTKELNVDGSVTPVIARITPAFLTPELDFDITAVSIFIEDTAAAIDTSLFGALPALTNGVVFRKVDGTTKNIYNIKTNGDIIHTSQIWSFVDKAPAGSVGLVAMKQFNGQGNSGVVVRLNSVLQDQLNIIINDDLTGLDKFNIKVLGHVFQV